MSIFQISSYVDALKRSVPYIVILPNDVSELLRTDNPHYERPTKSLYLYHGFTGVPIDWLTGSHVQELAAKNNLAIILPSGENSFYLNGQGVGRNYETFVGQELVDYVSQTFHLSRAKEDVFVGGLSMGGFGAIHTGFKFPETFGKIVALSSALVVNTLITMAPGTVDAIADYDYYVSTFGELPALATNGNNPEVLIKDLKAAGTALPALYMACGTEDFLLAENREFHQFLLAQDVPVTYLESAGDHDWTFWNKYLDLGVQWLLEDQK